MYLVPLNYALTVKMKNITLCVFYHDRFLKKRSHLFHPEKILTPHNVETVALGLWIATKWVMNACTLSHARLFATSWTIAYPPGSSLHGILQERILGWVAISFSRGSSWPRDQISVPRVPCMGKQILYHCATWAAPDYRGIGGPVFNFLQLMNP